MTIPEPTEIPARLHPSRRKIICGAFKNGRQTCPGVLADADPELYLRMPEGFVYDKKTNVWQLSKHASKLAKQGLPPAYNRPPILTRRFGDEVWRIPAPIPAGELPVRVKCPKCGHQQPVIQIIDNALVRQLCGTPDDEDRPNPYDEPLSPEEEDLLYTW